MAQDGLEVFSLILLALATVRHPFDIIAIVALTWFSFAPPKEHMPGYRAAFTKALIRSADLTPGADSTPEETST
jgi:hypothetical protein